MTCSTIGPEAVAAPDTGTYAVSSIGNIATDVTIELEGKLPAHTGDHGRATQATIDLGGSLNVLIAASRLGTPCAPVGFVSNETDGASGFLRSAIRTFGFCNTDGVVPRIGYRSPLCAVFVEPGRGSTFLATNETPSVDADTNVDLPDAMRNVLTRTQAVCVDGYAVAGEPGLVSSVLAECDDMLQIGGMDLWFDPQSCGASRCSDPVFSDVLAKATALAVTEDGAREMLGMGRSAVPMVADVISALTRVMRKSAHLLVVKRGPLGCIVAYRPDREARAWVVNSVPGFDVGDVRDTTGCGDSFLGGLIAGLTTHKLSVVDSCILANAVGAATALRVGAGVNGVAARVDVENLLAQNDSAIDLGQP